VFARAELISIAQVSKVPANAGLERR